MPSGRNHMIAPILVAVTLALVPAGPASAQMGGWGGPGSYSRHDRGWGRDWPSHRQQSRREGQVDAAQFAADGAADSLGHGEIRLAVLPDSTPEQREQLDYEAAMLDRLGAAGYDISGTGAGAPQVAQIRIQRDIAEPAEERHNPVSGESSVMVSNHGTAVGMALSLDFTEPQKALIATRMELQIIDVANGTVLWEGRASILTRDQDEHWDDAAIANRLAAALLDGFPAHPSA
jgi:hypothetical protein